jgi:hypothetical protein
MAASRTSGGGVTVTVKIDQAALSRFLTAPGHDVNQWVTLKLNQVRNRAVVLCPVRTGRLRSSIQITEPAHPVGAYDVAGEVGTNVEYAWWVHEGRGPVRPITARVLHWVSPSGEDVFRPYAGPAKGQPFLDQALREVM